MTKGIIHSAENFGAADGEGVRYIFFTGGCNFRCKYCHNPDTWAFKGNEMTAEEAYEKTRPYRSYRKNGGGITVSGGEPLLQIDFLTELFKIVKENGETTCIDTAGQPFTRDAPFFGKFKELMKYTDLLLLDIKEINPERHKRITGADNANILDMAGFLDEINKPVWIRYVLVPEYSDFDEDLYALREFLDTLRNVKRVEILPYHTLGKYKWDNLGIKYELENICPPTAERISNAEKILKQ